MDRAVTKKAAIRLALTHSTRLQLPALTDFLVYFFLSFSYNLKFWRFFIYIFSREFCIWFMDSWMMSKSKSLNVLSRKSETEETNESKSCVGSRKNIKLTNQNPSLQKLKEYFRIYRGGWRVLLGGARHRCCRRCGNEIERKRVEREIPHTYTYGLWERLQDFASKKPFR